MTGGTYIKIVTNNDLSELETDVNDHLKVINIKDGRIDKITYLIDEKKYITIIQYKTKGIF